MTHPTRRSPRLSIILACGMATAAIAACGSSGSDKDDGGGDADTDADADTDGDTDVDAVSAATPEVASARLGASHTGFGIADCAACHGGVHDEAAFSPADCAACHGTAGFPPLPAGHFNGGCADCHGEAHAGLGFDSPGDCRACHRFEPPAGGECAVESGHDVVIIGAGGGGLGAAAYLARQDLDVVVLERHYKVGGYMVNFERGDYRFEASLHAMDGLDPEPFGPDPSIAKGMNVRMFRDELGIWDKIRPVKADPMYTIKYPDHDFDVPADAGEYLALLQAQFPGEAENLAGMFDELARIDHVMRVILDYQHAGKDIEGEHMQEFFDEITDKGLLDDLLLVQQYMTGSTLGDFLDGHLDDERLITIWTQLAGFAGAEPDKVSALFFIVMWNNYHFGGFYYFEGGSQAVSDALAEVVVENGGMIRTHSLVTKIDIEDGLAARVRTADGSCYAGRYVVSNANAPATMLQLVGAEHLPTDADDPYHPDKLSPGNPESLAVGLPAFQVCLGVAHDYTPLFGDSHEVMLNSSYSQAENFAWYMDSDIENAPYAIANYVMLDPEAAPAGKNTICLTSMLMFDWEDQWRWNESHEAYRRFKHQVGMRLVDRAEQDFLPGLTQYIEKMEVGSPLTLFGFTLNPRGSIFGWDNVPEQSMTRRLPQQTPIDNLLLAGAWTFPGGGQSAVLTSGMLAGQAIMARE